MNSHNYNIQKSVRYFTIGKPTAQVKHLWVCLHGYGQLADWFGKRFEKWASKERLFVFPEGPHRFYSAGTNGRVGASWMSRDDRERWENANTTVPSAFLWMTRKNRTATPATIES